MRTIEQLTTTPTADETFDTMIGWLVAQGVPADKWRQGGVGRSILRAVAQVYVLLASLITLINGAGYLETATGDFLTLLARYVYGVERVVATFASGTVTLTNSGGGVYTWNPGELVVRNSVTKKLYRNTAIVTLLAGATLTGVAVEALELGTASNAGAGEVSELAVVAAGVTVTNPSPIVGVDEQIDESLRAECLAKLGALSMAGPRGAYSYAIQSAKNGGVPVNVNRWVISPASSTGVVSVRVASPSGAADAGDVTAIADSIENVARPDSVTLDLATVTTATYAYPLVVWARATPGVTAASLQTKVLAALASYAASYPIGGLRKPPSSQGYLYDDSVQAVAKSADPLIFAVDSTGGADLPLSFGQVPIITSTVDVRLVATAVTS